MSVRVDVITIFPELGEGVLGYSILRRAREGEVVDVQVHDLRAHATEGIQRGHMSLHARQVAIAAGASGEIDGVNAPARYASRPVTGNDAAIATSDQAFAVEQY